MCVSNIVDEIFVKFTLIHLVYNIYIEWLFNIIVSTKRFKDNYKKRKLRRVVDDDSVSNADEFVDEETFHAIISTKGAFICYFIVYIIYIQIFT